MYKNFLNISDLNKNDIVDILETANRIENKSLHLYLINLDTTFSKFTKPSQRPKLSPLKPYHDENDKHLVVERSDIPRIQTTSC